MAGVKGYGGFDGFGGNGGNGLGHVMVSHVADGVVNSVGGG